MQTSSHTMPTVTWLHTTRSFLQPSSVETCTEVQLAAPCGLLRLRRGHAQAARVAFEARRRRGKVLHPPVQAPPRPEQKRSRSIGRAQRSCHGGGADEAAGTTWCSSGSEADTEEPCEFVPVDSHHLENLD
mmetsp:Transcript_104043/g.325584  ORF Transcript_104043/g.325584 Transcript_104043/m.325584 type:complete len:131 (+) Transcript_104043:115-507(+)